MGSLYDVLARGIQPVKVQNPFAYQQAKQATALQAEQIKEAQLGEQSKQLEIQNAQRNQASAQALMDIWKQNGGDFDKTAQAAAASGKVLPDHLATWQEHTALMKKNLADTDKAQLDNLAKKHELAESQVHALLSQPEDQAAAQFTPMMKGMIEQGEVTPQELQSAGIDPSTYPGHDKMELFRQGIAGSKLLMEQEKAKREGDKSQAETQNYKAELPGKQAESKLKTAEADALAQFAQDPSKALTQIDSIFPTSVKGNQEPNFRYKSQLQFALQRGDMKKAMSVIDKANEEAGTVAKETNPQVQSNKIATSAAEGQAHAAATIAAQRAQYAGSPVANVPPHLAPTALTAYEKSGATLANAQTHSEEIQAVLDMAQAGNKAAGANVPLMGVGAVNAVNGIKRINSAEIHQYGTAGSLLDRIQGKLQGWTEGKPIPADVLNDMKALHAELSNTAPLQHQREVQAINKAYGAKFEPMQFEAKQAAAPSTSYKAGDKRVVKGKTYVRDDKGTWTAQ